MVDLEPVDNVFKLWRRVPGRIRGAVPVLAIVTLAATYPYYVSSLPTDVPVILAFPDVGAAVTILVFVVMAVGLNVVVGYAGLLDLGYVAFYAIGAYTAGWLASGQFEQVRFHFGSVGISREAQGIHISVWLVLLFAGLITAARRDPDRTAHPSPSRRLSRDRHARASARSSRSSSATPTACTDSI